jgi:hypothetical protein
MPATNLPPVLQTLGLFLCEKILQEKDDVLTYIRNVELFNVVIVPEVPIERQGPTMTVVIIGKVRPNDTTEHTVQLHLIRPSGETKIVGDEVKAVFTSRLPEYPGGFNIVQQMTVSAKEMGLHYMAVLFDGEEVARTPFMLQPATGAAQ